jgi:hypothetical protein
MAMIMYLLLYCSCNEGCLICTSVHPVVLMCQTWEVVVVILEPVGVLLCCGFEVASG